MRRVVGSTQKSSQSGELGGHKSGIQGGFQRSVMLGFVSRGWVLLKYTSIRPSSGESDVYPGRDDSLKDINVSRRTEFLNPYRKMWLNTPSLMRTSRIITKAGNLLCITPRMLEVSAQPSIDPHIPKNASRQGKVAASRLNQLEKVLTLKTGSLSFSKLPNSQLSVCIGRVIQVPHSHSWIPDCTGQRINTQLIMQEAFWSSNTKLLLLTVLYSYYFSYS